ncbi:MAG: PKD domain-containing protein [Gammaproteobacteria bacterium]|nr:PKD domain-containing protein [Gammaproteobacteria bacterium]
MSGGDDPYRYQWDNTDISSGKTINHTFGAAGKYQITVTDSKGELKNIVFTIKFMLRVLLFRPILRSKLP